MKEYECEECKKKITADNPENCCGKVMRPLPLCTSDPSFVEHFRPMDSDEPCDDGR